MTYRQRQVRKRRGRSRVGRRLLLAFGVLTAIGLIAVASLVGYVLSIAASAPDIKDLKPIDKGASSVIFAADGSRLGYVQSDEIRTPIEWKDMPQLVRQATVAIEDRRFYDHGPIDYPGLLRAAFKDITAGKALQGGSTITQQLVRQLYISDPKRDLTRKIKEAKMAQELASQHSKTWILWQYLNDVPYGTVGGRSAIGIEAAAETYFGVHAKHLKLDQAAMLAGLPQAPSQYNPLLDPRAALERRNDVLRAMAKSGYITLAQAASASAKPLGLHPGKLYLQRREPYFFDYVQQQLIDRYGEATFKRGGLRVYTTVDPKLQKAGRAAINKNLYLPTDPSSAIVSIDPHTGYIKAMASSGKYGDRTFNLAAQGHRQPGSAFKTFVLTTAVSEGVDPSKTTYVSKPLSLPIPGFGFWHVKTYDNTYGGAMNLVTATLKSDNTVYAQLDIDLGPKKIAETAHKMGITTKLDGVPSEGLGGLRLGVSPLEMADAYATLAAGGIHSDPQAIKKVVFPDGKVDDLGKPKRQRVLPNWVAGVVVKILEQNMQKGTATAANIGCPGFAKTGTTDNFNDAWLDGSTPDMTTAVWVGYPNALKQMRGVHGINVAGGTIPAQIWHDYMSVAHGSQCNDFGPFDTPQFSAFYGKHSTNGLKPGSGYGGPGSGAGSYGGNRGYNPNLYASPPQGPPNVKPPKSGDGGKHHGGGPGAGGGGGDHQAPDATPPATSPNGGAAPPGTQPGQ